MAPLPALAAIAGAIILVSLGLYAFARHLQRRDPYAAFLRLKTRQKVAFFKRVLSDRRVPWAAKLIPNSGGALSSQPH